MSTPLTIAGLPVEGTHDISCAVSAIACVKGFDGDGDIAYWFCGTGGITRVEALGMALALLDSLRDGDPE